MEGAVALVVLQLVAIHTHTCECTIVLLHMEWVTGFFDCAGFGFLWFRQRGACVCSRR